MTLDNPNIERDRRTAAEGIGPAKVASELGPSDDLVDQGVGRYPVIVVFQGEVFAH